MDFSKVVNSFFPGESAVVIKVDHSGASGPSIVIFEVEGKKFALKFGESRVPIKKQIESRALLSPFFENHLVPLLGYQTEEQENAGAILMPAYSFNLHDAVMERLLSQEKIVVVWADVLAQMRSLWSRTKETWDNPNGLLRRDPVTRIAAVEKAVKSFSFLDHYWNAPVMVNGVEYPPLQNIFKKIFTSYQPPAVSVLCHGDLNANNIMVLGDSRWALADWEWCGLHDWRLSCSHLVGWWLSCAATAECLPACVDERGRVVLRYATKTVTPLASKLAGDAYRNGENFAVAVQEKNYSLQMRCLLATLLFGEIRFLAARGLPVSHATYLLGTAVCCWAGEIDFFRPS